MRSARLLVLALGALLAGVLLVGRPAGAVGNPDYTVPPPATIVTTPTSEVSTEVVTAVKARPVRTRLALTGSDAGTAAAVGAALVAAGGGILVLRRRRMAPT